MKLRSQGPFPIDRREFLRAGGASVALAVAWPLTARGRAIAEPATGDVRLVAAEADIDVGTGAPWRTWAYNGTVPGPIIRATEGERLRVILENRLPEPTTIHWHGLPVPPGMDGVPDLSQRPVQPGETFTYDFIVPASGTFFYHSHVGLQLDRGLSGALIVAPRDDRADEVVDREQVLLVDDWLRGAPAMAFGPGMMGGGPVYDGYLLNGRAQSVPPITLERGERLRLRLINASAASTMRIGVTGHRLSVTHADGQRVATVDVDTIVLGMGERVDATIVGGNPGAWQVIAGPADSVVPGVAAPLLYPGYQPRVSPLVVWPSALLSGRILGYDDLEPADPLTALVPSSRQIPLVLSGGMGMMGSGAWTINGEAYPSASPIPVRQGEQVRLSFWNQSMVRHPMHLHGHFFRLVTGGRLSAVKDTVLVEAMERRDVVFNADHPGRWLLHCHHAYHMEAGMARVVGYVS